METNKTQERATATHGERKNEQRKNEHGKNKHLTES